jgi:hypothetical protein
LCQIEKFSPRPGRQSLAKNAKEASITYLRKDLKVKAHRR